jgi:threonine synthase
MGLPVHCLVAATNVNDFLPTYLNTGVYSRRPSVTTLSNAMDVSVPSNFDRILDLYGGDRAKLDTAVKGFSFTDDQTRAAIGELHARFGYVSDPHGAVGYLGMKSYFESVDENVTGIFLETAHPAKFPEIVEEITRRNIEVPLQIKQALARQKAAIKLDRGFDQLKEYLLY